MRDTTPFASFLPLNGFILVLRNDELARRRRALPEQPAQQAVLRRQRRPRSAVSDRARRAVRRAPEGRAASTVVYQPQPEGRAQHRVVARGEGLVRGVRPRASARSAARHADLGDRRGSRDLPTTARTGWSIDKLRAGDRAATRAMARDLNDVLRRWPESRASELFEPTRMPSGPRRPRATRQHGRLRRRAACARVSRCCCRRTRSTSRSR